MFSSILPYLPLSTDFTRYFYMLYYGYQAREYLGPTPTKQHHWNIPIAVPHQVTLSDLDELGHMNNIRYIRYAEFVRIYCMMCLKIWECITRRNQHIDRYNKELKVKQKHQHNLTNKDDDTVEWKKSIGFVLGNMMIRYRKELQFKEKFSVTCKIIGWDETAVYFEHLIINQRNIVCCYIICQQVTVNIKATELMNDITNDISPSLPSHVIEWLNTIDLQKQHIPRNTTQVHEYLGDGQQMADTPSDADSTVTLQRGSKL